MVDPYLCSLVLLPSSAPSDRSSRRREHRIPEPARTLPKIDYDSPRVCVRVYPSLQRPQVFSRIRRPALAGICVVDSVSLPLICVRGLVWILCFKHSSVHPFTTLARDPGRYRFVSSAYTCAYRFFSQYFSVVTRFPRIVALTRHLAISVHLFFIPFGCFRIQLIAYLYAVSFRENHLSISG